MTALGKLQCGIRLSGQRQLWVDRPPRHGSSPALSVYGGAQRGISLARGFFTGEATLASLARIIIQDQGLKRSPIWLKWILFGIHFSQFSQFEESTLAKSHIGSQPRYM